jgi:secondary thiamine-phosphate synthase enzyme
VYEYQINTNKRCELIRIDRYLTQAITDSGLREGALVAYIPHTTAGILINENADPAVAQDILDSLEKKVPFSDGYTHMEGNSAAHIKTALVGSSVHIPVSNGKPMLGTWQSVFFAEFDGPRRRRMWITPLAGHAL